MSTATTTKIAPTQTQRGGTTDEPDQRGWIRRLIASCRAHPGLAVWTLLVAGIASGVGSVPPLFMRIGLNDALSGRTDRIFLIAAGLGGSGLIVFIGSFIRQFLSAKLALTVQHDLRTSTFASLQRLDGAGQDQLRTGQVMSRANIDLQMVQGFLGQAPSATGGVVMVIVSFVAMVWLSPLLSLIQLAMVVGCALVTWWSSRRLGAATWAVQHRNAVLAQLVTESVSGAYVVTGFGQERREVDRFTEESGKLFGERMRVANLQSQPMATLQSLPLLAQIGVLLAGGALAVNGSIRIGDFVAFAAFTTLLTAPAGMLSNLVVAAQLTRPAAERVYDLLDTNPSVFDAPDARPLEDGELEIELSGVTFGYTADEPVLQDLSLTVAPGETVALVGPSGSGKSTVALLLPRFYDPQQGSVRIGPPGRLADVGEYSLASLRQRVGVVFEEPFLFAGSVADNISYGHRDAGRDEIERVAREAGAADFIAALPEAYDSEVGEKGSSLSGGQRQRIALARTLLSEPRILVLDDATSAVDAATAAEIQTALQEVAATHTTIVIAHRKATLALAQRIVVLDRGRVVDSGTEAELLERCEVFADLFGDPDESAAVEVEALALNADGISPELWASLSPAEQAREGGAEDSSAQAPAPTDTVLLDGMQVERQQADDVAALADPHARPAARLSEPDDRPAPKRLFDILRPVKGLVVIAAALMSVDAVVTALLPNLIQRGIDGGVVAKNLNVVWSIALVAVLVIAVNWVALFFQPRAIARTGESAMFSVRVRSYRHLHSLGLDHFGRERSGGLLTRMTTDVASLADFVEAGLTVAVINVLTVLAMVVAMLLIDWQLALWSFSVLPILIVATVIFRKLSGVAYEKTRDQVGAVNSDLQENLEGLRTSQSHGQESGEAEKFSGLSEGLRKIRLKAQSYSAAYFPFIGLLAQVATVVVLVIGIRGVADHTLLPGVLTAFLLYLGLFFAPFQQLSQVFDGYQRAKVGAGRIAELLATKPSVVAPAEPAAIGAGLNGAVRFDRVGFSYASSAGDGRSAEPALIDIDGTIEPGQRLALVGETGSGKSTLIKLVGRFYDATSGAITVDDRPIGDYDPVALRQRLGVVPQEAHLFTGNLADNIRYGRPEASDAEVQEAARVVGALDMIAGLPGGFRHPLNEGGGGLSTGQRQLVALARAQLADPDILLLDEPTASLDAAAERAVLKAMDEVAARRTTVLVTHRLASAARSDLIWVLDHGRVVESGQHDDLVAADGRYAKLWALDQAEAKTDQRDETPSTEEVDPTTRTLSLPRRAGRKAKAVALVGAVVLQIAALSRKFFAAQTRPLPGEAESAEPSDAGQTSPDSKDRA